MWRDLTEHGRWDGEIWNQRKNGEAYPEQLTISAVRDTRGNTQQYVALFTDISLRKQLEDQIRQLAFYDPLTHLPNRRLLDDRLNQTRVLSKRSGCYGALMFLDLDNFKSLNDRHGHVVGDLLLMEVADRLRSCVREIDTVARFGGDEFVVMLSDLSPDQAESTAQAGLVAEKIQTALSAPYHLVVSHAASANTLVEHRCSASIGVLIFLGTEGTQDEFLKWADAAMYQAKAAGRNSIRFHASSPSSEP
jgi:diguanylate cyclase (GGDEF)-like protein